MQAIKYLAAMLLVLSQIPVPGAVERLSQSPRQLQEQEQSDLVVMGQVVSYEIRAKVS